LCQQVLRDARFHRQLFEIDADLAARPKNALLDFALSAAAASCSSTPCSAALQGRLRRLDFALLAATKMASSRYGTFSAAS